MRILNTIVNITVIITQLTCASYASSDDSDKPLCSDKSKIKCDFNNKKECDFVINSFCNMKELSSGVIMPSYYEAIIHKAKYSDNIDTYEIPISVGARNAENVILANFNNKLRYIGNAGGINGELLKTKTNGFYDFLDIGHMSAKTSSYSYYRYNGTKYIMYKCNIESSLEQTKFIDKNTIDKYKYVSFYKEDCSNKTSKQHFSTGKVIDIVKAINDNNSVFIIIKDSDNEYVGILSGSSIMKRLPQLRFKNVKIKWNNYETKDGELMGFNSISVL